MTGKSIAEQLQELEWDAEFGIREIEDDITEQVVCLLDAREKNRTWLASELGVSKQRISNILSGSQNLTLHTVVKLAFAFGLRPSVHLDSSVCIFSLDGATIENQAIENAVSGQTLDSTMGSYYRESSEQGSASAITA